MFSARDPSDIDRFFRGVTEYAFHARLGIVDPPLVEYVSLLLVRFLRHESLVARPGGTEAAADVGGMLLTAAQRAEADVAREEYRHIGDVTLFWSGLYPEALRRAAPAGDDHLAGYREAGKRAYWLASTLEPPTAESERRLLEQLSHDYDLCVEGLGEVRRVWGERA